MSKVVLTFAISCPEASPSFKTQTFLNQAPYVNGFKNACQVKAPLLHKTLLSRRTNVEEEDVALEKRICLWKYSPQNGRKCELDTSPCSATCRGKWEPAVRAQPSSGDAGISTEALSGKAKRVWTFLGDSLVAEKLKDTWFKQFSDRESSFLHSDFPKRRSTREASVLVQKGGEFLD